MLSFRYFSCHKFVQKSTVNFLSQKRFNSKIMSCCPSTAWGELKNPDYKEKGKVEKIDDLDIYVVGNGSKCIIWNYDVFGFNGGRTRQMCDFLAESGYLVIMPDYYRGTMCDPSKDGDKLPGKFCLIFTSKNLTSIYGI